MKGAQAAAADDGGERQEGMSAGLEHEAASLRSVLEKILSKRFAQVPPGTSARISTASIEQTLEWIDRALEVERIEDLFGPPAPH